MIFLQNRKNYTSFKMLQWQQGSNKTKGGNFTLEILCKKMYLQVLPFLNIGYGFSGLLNESHPRVFQETTLPLFRDFQVSLAQGQLVQAKVRKVQLGQISLTQAFESPKNPGVTLLQVIRLFLLQLHRVYKKEELLSNQLNTNLAVTTY